MVIDDLPAQLTIVFVYFLLRIIRRKNLTNVFCFIYNRVSCHMMEKPKPSKRFFAKKNFIIIKPRTLSSTFLSIQSSTFESISLFRSLPNLFLLANSFSAFCHGLWQQRCRKIKIIRYWYWNENETRLIKMSDWNWIGNHRYNSPDIIIHSISF